MIQTAACVRELEVRETTTLPSQRERSGLFDYIIGIGGARQTCCAGTLSVARRGGVDGPRSGIPGAARMAGSPCPSAARKNMGRAESRGTPHPLGASLFPDGANFALFSEHSEAVELCLFDSPRQRRPTEVLPLASRTGRVFHARFAGIRAGQIYGYRVHGPWDPGAGHRFDPCKVLLDPCARAIARPPKWGPEVYSYRSDAYPNPAALDQAGSNLDSGDCSPLGIVVDTAPPLSAAIRLGTSWRDTLIYELHVRGFTRLHPDVDPGLRGTYAGLASEPVLEHLRSLGVSAVELLPVQHFVDDHRLARLGLTNYWGYQPLGYFAPEPRYAAATGAAVSQEFRDMVGRFHQAGIEVILDVVYNHTAEQGHDGPTLSFRGIDNASYYRLEPRDRRRYVDYTGCGNTLNTQHPAVVRLVMDSLRYWVEAMGVDGFRFDLATVIGRTERGFDRRAPLLAAISQDPVLRSVKLIAEPWDVNSHDSMQLGNYPSDWAEWNLRFRDETRRFWRGDAHMVPPFATRVAGSSDVFGLRRRSPQSSVNFVASHDGFTLADLVTYTHKHNSANGESNRDGEQNSHSWNCGAEGPTQARQVLAVRERQQRNLLATLLLSQGVPMLAAGDEFGRTQRGNNNAYCQDNQISWVDWAQAEGSSLLEFARRLVQIRRNEPALRRERFFEGLVDPETGLKDVAWLHPSGEEIAAGDWNHDNLQCFGALVAAGGGAALLLLFNGSERRCIFCLPEISGWKVELDTAQESCAPTELDGREYQLTDRSFALLRTEGG